MTHPPGGGQAAEVDVDALAAAVAACPGVAGLHGGAFGEVASYLPGRAVAGVRVAPGAVEVHVRGRWGTTAAQLLAQIGAAAAPLIGGRRLQVVLADLEDPAEPGAEDGAAPSRPALPAPASPSPPLSP